MTDAGQQPEAIESIEETLAEVRRMIYADSANLPEPSSPLIPSSLDGDSSRLPSDAGPPSRPDTGDVSGSGLAGISSPGDQVRDRNGEEDQAVMSSQAALHRLEGRIDQLSQMLMDHLVRHHGR
jgi:hypothetical protein